MAFNSKPTFVSTRISFGAIKDAYDKVGLNSVPVTQLDLNYYTAGAEVWTQIIDRITKILKPLKWTAEINDCDNRATLATCLVAILYGLNTFGNCYGQITNTETGKKSQHWFNIFVLPNGDLYLWDIEKRAITKIEKGKDIILGNWKYSVESVRYF